MICAHCNATIEREKDSIGTGYAVNDKGEHICYACCAIVDAHDMMRTGRATLYEASDRLLTNWPGTLRIPCGPRRESFHNIARYRYDIWFTFRGESWHGTRYGDNTQIVHCKRVKGTR